MKPFWIEGKQAWAVDVPARMSPTGKRQRKFFANRDKARDFCGDRKEQHLEHGKQAISAEERRWIGFLRESIGDLERLPSIVEHWKRTGEKLNRISIDDAVTEFLDSAVRDYPNHRTLNDIKERMAKFRDAFNGRDVHEVNPTDIERFLETYSAGWHRWSVHKPSRAVLQAGQTAAMDRG
jgi:hypothetical protein